MSSGATPEDVDDLKGSAVEWMQDSITIEPFSSQDAYGKPTYGAAITVDALVQSYGKMIRLANGEETVASTKIMIAPGPVFNTKARLTLPDGSHPQILRIDGMIQSALTITVDIYT